MLREGKGVPVDMALAVAPFKRGVASSNPLFNAEFACMLAEGVGVAAGLPRARGLRLPLPKACPGPSVTMPTCRNGARAVPGTCSAPWSISSAPSGRITRWQASTLPKWPGPTLTSFPARSKHLPVAFGLERCRRCRMPATLTAFAPTRRLPSAPKRWPKAASCRQASDPRHRRRLILPRGRATSGPKPR